jgi:hypothetical protein
MQITCIFVHKLKCGSKNNSERSWPWRWRRITWNFFREPLVVRGPRTCETNLNKRSRSTAAVEPTKLMNGTNVCSLVLPCLFTSCAGETRSEWLQQEVLSEIVAEKYCWNGPNDHMQIECQMFALSSPWLHVAVLRCVLYCYHCDASILQFSALSTWNQHWTTVTWVMSASKLHWPTVTCWLGVLSVVCLIFCHYSARRVGMYVYSDAVDLRLHSSTLV